MLVLSVLIPENDENTSNERFTLALDLRHKSHAVVTCFFRRAVEVVAEIDDGSLKFEATLLSSSER